MMMMMDHIRHQGRHVFSISYINSYLQHEQFKVFLHISINCYLLSFFGLPFMFTLYNARKP